MKRKIVSIVIVIAVLVSFFCCRNYMSIDKQIERFYNNAVKDIPNAVLYDLSENKIMFEKNIDEKISVGSIVKVLSVCIGFKYFKPDDTMLVGEEVNYPFPPDSSQSMISPEQKLTFEQLLYAILLPSGNDATLTLAVNTARKINNDPDMPVREAIACFSDEMNKLAKELGCSNSHFVNPNGMDDKKQYTCISDIIIIAKKALEYELFRKVVNTSYIALNLVSGEAFTWYNTNYMLFPDSDYYFEGCTGIKTGHTDEAGYCLLSCAERNGKKLLSVVCNCKYKETRFTIASRLFEVGFFADSLKK